MHFFLTSKWCKSRLKRGRRLLDTGRVRPPSSRLQGLGQPRNSTVKMLFPNLLVYLPSSWSSLVSLTFIAFVSILFLAKIYIKIRSRFSVLVNCWFCNRNTRVPYEKYNSWDCPYCCQYNGFTDDGDYNREIISQFASKYVQFSKNENGKTMTGGENSLCQPCNDNQLIKVQKLAAFEAEQENTYALELQKFRETLEDTYRLCPRCEKKLRRVLSEKKKMVLGLRLAQKGVKPSFTKKFIKPLHVQTSIAANRYKKLINIILFLIALLNWINITYDLKLNRDHLESKFGDVITSIIFFSISHLVAFTKVMIKYFSAIFELNFIEKLLLFIKTAFYVVEYSVGFDLYKYFNVFKDALNPSTIPFGAMFLAFGGHMFDGFRITKKTYLLALWSAYSYLMMGMLTKEDSVIKVTTALIILVLSLPSFSRKNDLQDILSNSLASSFHRIHSDDDFADNTTNKVNHSKSLNNTLNVSGNSTSSCSISPISIGSCRKSITSSTLNLCATPTSAFKTYSTQYLNNTQNNCFNESFTFNRVPKSFSTNTINTTLSETPLRVRSPLHVDANLNASFGPCSTPQSFVSCATSSTTRRNLLSPSHFAGMNNSVCCNAYTTPAQSPCPLNSGFYNNFDDKVEKQKNYIFSNVIPHENGSRGSSQSSGFESISGSYMHPVSEKFYNHENSVVGRADDTFSTCPEQFNSFDSVSMIYSAPPQSPHSNRNNVFQSKPMNFETGDHWIRNTANQRRQVFNAADLWPQLKPNLRSSSAFDLNGMNSYLPPVRKRYNLLGNLNESVDKDV